MQVIPRNRIRRASRVPLLRNVSSSDSTTATTATFYLPLMQGTPGFTGHSPRGRLVSMRLPVRLPRCIAVGEQSIPPSIALVTVNGGTKWTVEDLPGPGNFSPTGIACPSILECFVVGISNSPAAAAIVATTDGGTSWVDESLPRDVLGLSDIACPTTSECTAVGTNGGWDVIIATRNGGSSWTTQTSQIKPGPASGLGGVACPSTLDCTAVGGTNESPSNGVVLSTTNGGTTWTSRTVSTGALTNVACLNSMDCYVAGWATQAGGAAVLVTQDGGRNWTSRVVPTTIADLTSIACTSDSGCYVVGEYTNDEQIGSDASDSAAVLATSDGGASWVNQSVLPEVDGLTGVACPENSECLAVGGGSVTATVDGGRSWAAQTIPSGVSDVNAIACPSTSSCTAVGSGILNGSSGGIIVTANGGRNSTSATTPLPVETFENVDLTAVACPSISHCTAVGYNSWAGTLTGIIISTVDGGAVWKSETLPSGAGTLEGISCPSVLDCTVVGTTNGGVGEILSSRTAEWSGRRLPYRQGSAGSQASPAPPPRNAQQ